MLFEIQCSLVLQLVPDIARGSAGKRTREDGASVMDAVPHSRPRYARSSGFQSSPCPLQLLRLCPRLHAAVIL